MSLTRRILFALLVAAMSIWALAVVGVLKVSQTTEFALWGLWMLLLLAETIVERRERPKDWQAREPSPASNAAGGDPRDRAAPA